jgi:coenzyme F420-reducing hydrogenase delta subunit/Pyruvate/2-oxoacid:ferredoxin oxidoreductase delta subunit
MPLIRKTLVIGNGPCALSIARDLLAKGIEVVIVSREKDLNFPLFSDSKNTEKKLLEVLTKTRLIACHGSVGSFNISMDRDGDKITRAVANAVIAEEDVKKPNFSHYGLIPSSSVLPLSRISDQLNGTSKLNDSFLKGKKMVFLNGLFKESNPIITETVMNCSLKLQSDFNSQTYILTKNLKVAGNGLEALYRETKKAGAVYIKFTDTMPKINQDRDGNVGIDFFDEIMLEQFRLSPDITIIDETISPPDYLKNLAEILDLDTDPAGFVQTDNVHRTSVFTNIKGILAAGPSRCIQSISDHFIDAGNAVISTIALMNENLADLPDKAEINQNRCIRCFTCYRLCPYRAIAFDKRVAIEPEACEGCGICAAECPRKAISVKDLSHADISEQIRHSQHNFNNGAFVPFILAFCCRRSASQARELASCMGHKLPQGLKIIEVPCSGSVSIYHLLSAFGNNADGVLVLTCHEGNCHSERGNIFIRRRVEKISHLLPQIGFEKERIAMKTLASNMGKEFTEIVNSFERKIFGLGRAI